MPRALHCVGWGLEVVTLQHRVGPWVQTQHVKGQPLTSLVVAGFSPLGSEECSPWYSQSHLHGPPKKS